MNRHAMHVGTLAILAVALACSAGGLTAPAFAQGKSGSAPGHVRPPTDTTTVTPPDTTTVTVTVTPVGCPASGYTRLVSVSTEAQLSSALANAQPGDQIRLASGTYTGFLHLARSGTAAAPIRVCGPRTAILTSGSLTSGNGIILDAVQYVVLAGFSARTASTCVVLKHSSWNQIVGLDCGNVGFGGINLKYFSSHNELRGNLIHDTGRSAPQYGEGIYVGTAPTQWCTYTACGPDRADSNRIVGNTIGPNIGSDPMDVKAGTIGTIADSNTIDARGSGNLSGDQNWEGGLGIVNGQRALIRWNRGSGAAYHGFSVQNDGNASAYPASATFVGNVVDLSGTTGYGFLVGYRAGGTVYCAADAALGNHVSGSTKFSNVACAP